MKESLKNTLLRSNNFKTNADTRQENTNPSYNNIPDSVSKITSDLTTQNYSPIANETVQFVTELDQHIQLVADLEFCIYTCCDTLVNTRYFNLARRCAKVISENSVARNKLLNFQICINEFVLKCNHFSSFDINELMK